MGEVTSCALMEEAMKEREKEDQSPEIDMRTNLILDPDTPFGEKFEAVVTDMLKGKHISTAEPDDPGLYRKPAEDETKEDEPF